MGLDTNDNGLCVNEKGVHAETTYVKLSTVDSGGKERVLFEIGNKTGDILNGKISSTGGFTENGDYVSPGSIIPNNI